MHAAIAILAALLARGRSSRGAHLDVSATDGVLSLMSLSIDGYLATGEEPGPRADILTGRYACYDVYPARDGRFLAVAAIEPAFYANLCRALSLESWIPHQLDDARQDEIRAAFRAAFARRDRDEWIAELAPRDTCVSPVYTVPELARDAHLAERRSFQSAVHAERGPLRQLAPILAGASREPPGRPLGADSGGDAGELLRAAGLGDAEIERLRRDGVVA
jgi:alpha-methylacyl-CoA racemase